MFCFCYFGNRLTTTSMDVHYSIYENDWITASKSFKTSMLIIMLRLEKPLYLTIAGVSRVTLNTFVQIVKYGYSFLAVIRKSKF
ncbi:odorant receptor 59b-like [Agrilus planipennis]|uniref:Odorant receptor 59b-like n=1 Tax=Agrilus planipennis TaxID=224129 RepID=A0A1W4WQZ8_AGRPL|nr:odorant receptor 59b-like [Agrilus planipennis]